MLRDKVHTAHPVYYVRELAASLAFYGQRLGLEVEWVVEEAKLAGVRVNEGAIIVLSENAAKVAGRAAPVFVMNIDDVDSAYAELRARGVVFEGPPADEFYGRAVDLRDPDGHALCLVSSGE